MKHAEITAYKLPDGRKLQRRRQLDGTMKWRLCDPWLTHRTQQEEAPWNLRFETAELAYEAWGKIKL